MPCVIDSPIVTLHRRDRYCSNASILLFIVLLSNIFYVNSFTVHSISNYKNKGYATLSCIDDCLIQNKQTLHRHLLLIGFMTQQNDDHSIPRQTDSNELQRQSPISISVSKYGLKYKLVASAIIMTTITSSMIGCPLPAFAGLLDEYGTDFKTIQATSSNNNKDQSSTTSKVTSEINPTLRGCKYAPKILRVSFFMSQNSGIHIYFFICSVYLGGSRFEGRFFFLS
jgi:hypothetical protein